MSQSPSLTLGVVERKVRERQLVGAVARDFPNCGPSIRSLARHLLHQQTHEDRRESAGSTPSTSFSVN